MFPLNLYAHVRTFLLMHDAHETAGAARTRSSPRPLLRVALRPLFSRDANENVCLGQNHVARMRRRVSYPPLEGEGRLRSRRGGVKLRNEAVLTHNNDATPPRLTFRCASCEPTLPLQGRVRWSRCLLSRLTTRRMGPRVRGDDATPQNCTCVRIANALNFEPASPVLVALICLATVPCRKSNMKRTLPLMYQFSAAV